MLLDKLAFTENKYEELSVKISDPSIMANQKEWRKLCKEHADLEVIVTAYREYKKVVEDLEANKEMLEEETDKEMREMLSEEISSLKAQEEELENKIQILLLPKDPNYVPSHRDAGRRWHADGQHRRIYWQRRRLISRSITACA